MDANNKKSGEAGVTARLFELIMTMSPEEQQALLKELQEKGYKGKRQYNREPFMVVVEYTVEGRTYRDYIRNISAGGIFIETRMSFSVGQAISLSFPLPDFENEIAINGEIVRTSPRGIGVKFRIDDEEQEMMIKSLLNMLKAA